MNRTIVILSAKRTPMGGLQGSLAAKSAPELGSIAIHGAMEHCGLGTTAIDEVYMGCVLPAGLKQAPARQAALGAGIGEATPTTTINKVCGSGMKAVMIAADQIKTGNIDTAVAGGMESMSNAPYLLEKARAGYRLGHQTMYDHMFTDGLEDAYDGQSMGVHAQNTADDYSLTREQMDAYALESLKRAQHAIEQGHFVEEITPVTIPQRRGDNITINDDEQPGNARPDKIPTLRPAFKKDGSITAANASSISDGASAMIISHQEHAKTLSIKPLATIVDYCSHAQSPASFTCAPIGAIKKLLDRQQLTAEDIDLVELNEAFATVPLMAMHDIGFTHEQTNISGGACALGHPLGSSGSRIIVTLLHNLIRTGKKRGLASLCIGGGEATAILIEVNE